MFLWENPAVHGAAMVLPGGKKIISQLTAACNGVVLPKKESTRLPEHNFWLATTFNAIPLHFFTPSLKSILRVARPTDKVSTHLLRGFPTCQSDSQPWIAAGRSFALPLPCLPAGVFAEPPRGRSRNAPVLMRRCCFAIFPAKKSSTGPLLKSSAALADGGTRSRRSWKRAEATTKS